MAYISKEHQVRSFKPKKKHKQTKKKKVATPRPDAPYKCVGCGKEHYLSIHHVYGSSSRNASSKYMAVEYLCWACHQSSTGIHGTHSDGVLDKELKKKHQLRLLENDMSMDEFVKIFGRSYIGM